MRTFALVAVFMVSSLAPAESIFAADAPVPFDIPKLDNITIDGKAEDWAANGFAINVLADSEGKVKPVADLDAKARIAWNDQGLLFLVHVDDNVAVENANELWLVDSVEMFLAARPGSDDFYQLVVSPGLDPKSAKPREVISDQRKDAELKKIKLAPTYAASRTENGKTIGYTIEALLPWDALAVKPEAGREVAFQFYVNDVDAPGGSRFRLTWHPEAQTFANIRTGTHTVRLADKPSPAVNARAGAAYERFRRVKVNVVGAAELAGKRVDAQYATGKPGPYAWLVDHNARFVAKDGRAVALLTLPIPASTDTSVDARKIRVWANDALQPVLSLEDLPTARAKAFMDQRLALSAVFTSVQFPAIDFQQPSLVEDLIGPYQIQTAFYDANYNPVTLAERPGRYGAVVTITNEKGQTFRRFRTLFRTAEDFRWWRVEMPVTIGFPKEIGLDPIVVKEQILSTPVQEGLKWSIVGGSIEHGGYADLFAALHETKPGSPPATAFTDHLARDRAWWLPLKRKLYGNDTAFAKPVTVPAETRGRAAPTLRPGTPAEAGMKADTVEKLDALLKEWAAESKEPFNVCVARNGVIVLDRAYGDRNGKPMTPETMSSLASITKAFSGTAMMLAVDQGLVSLEDSADQFLPPFRIAGAKQPSIRQLYTHTAGMWDHRDEPEIDLEEIVGGYLPHLKIGQKHDYNGTSSAIGSAILEQVSGESLPAFYQKHFLAPLGMKHFEITNSSYNARGTAHDLALFGQMLLNKGAYGKFRFMKESTADLQLPHLLTRELSADTRVEWGIGLMWRNPEKTAIGHGAASSSTFNIYPGQQLIVTMARNTAGAHFDKYNTKFLALIQESIESK